MAKKFILKIVDKYLKYRSYKFHSNQFKAYLKKLDINPNISCKGESVYKNKWKTLSKHIDPYSYRFFSKFCGESPYIIPEDIGHTIIEYYLNPPKFRSLYSDKNFFSNIVGKQNLPQTFIYRILGSAILSNNGIIKTDEDISIILRNCKAIILKPSQGSCSGKGVVKFIKENDKFYSCDKNKNQLTIDYLLSYNNNFVIQEAIEQSKELSYLNSTSVNTIRLAIYRSVKTEKIHVTAGIIRVGHNGSYIDNAHGGGRFIGIDISNGKLGNTTLDQYGIKKNVWNDIDYSKLNFTIPNWGAVIEFAQYIGQKIKHHRLIALDIALDKNNNPLLIEYNIGGFSFWLFMLTNQLPLGDFTDEIIEYCKNQ